MLIECNKEKLNRVLNDFSSATGISINFSDDEVLFSLDPEQINNPLCVEIQKHPEGLRRCRSCDRGLLEKCSKSKSVQCHTCHAGLTDAALPICHGDMLLGYIIFGQMKTSPDFEKARMSLSEIIPDTEHLKELYDALPVFTEERIRAILSVAEMLAKYVLMESILKPNQSSQLTRVIDYIDKHLEKRLTVEEICADLYISKTTLYSLFHTHFSSTVTEYLNHRRIERAEQLLSDRDRSIESISQSVGFGSAAYFSRTFKKYRGISPAAYRKKLQSVSSHPNFEGIMHLTVKEQKA